MFESTTDKFVLENSPSIPPYEEYIEEIKDIWTSKRLTHQGPKYRLLEQMLIEYLNVEKILMFTNGHQSLELAIEALDLSGEVITTPFTFASTTHAIVRKGLTPVFCDIKPDDYTIDPARIEALITEKTSAIIPVHVYGNVCDVEAINSIAKKYGLKVIYDAAHAFGVKSNGVSVGNYGDISMFSFHASKVFNTVEGGGLVVHDDKIYQKLAQLRRFGMNGNYDFDLVGTNAKMTEFHAAMGICNLRHIDDEIKKRKHAAERYIRLLSDVRGLTLPAISKKYESNYSYFPVLVDGYRLNRDELHDRLLQNGIASRKYFYPLTSHFSAYSDRYHCSTPVAEWVSEHILLLPLFADLSDVTIDRICNVISKINFGW